MSDTNDELAEIRAELKRRGALPKPVTSVDYQPGEAYQIIVADSMNVLARSIAELSKTVTDIQAAQADLVSRSSAPRVRRIERDAEGNIAAIYEEQE